MVRVQFLVGITFLLGGLRLEASDAVEKAVRLRIGPNHPFQRRVARDRFDELLTEILADRGAYFPDVRFYTCALPNSASGRGAIFSMAEVLPFGRGQVRPDDLTIMGQFEILVGKGGAQLSVAGMYLNDAPPRFRFGRPLGDARYFLTSQTALLAAYGRALVDYPQTSLIPGVISLEAIESEEPIQLLNRAVLENKLGPAQAASRNPMFRAGVRLANILGLEVTRLTVNGSALQRWSRGLRARPVEDALNFHLRVQPAHRRSGLLMIRVLRALHKR